MNTQVDQGGYGGICTCILRFKRKREGEQREKSNVGLAILSHNL